LIQQISDGCHTNSMLMLQLMKMKIDCSPIFSNFYDSYILYSILIASFARIKKSNQVIIFHIVCCFVIKRKANNNAMTLVESEIMIFEKKPTKIRQSLIKNEYLNKNIPVEIIYDF